MRHLQSKRDQPSHNRRATHDLRRGRTSIARDGWAGGSGATTANVVCAVARCPDELEVRAGQPCGVGGVDDDGAVAEEARGALLGGGVEIEIGGLEGAGSGDVAVFAGEVAHLAGLRCGWVAGGPFAADVRVEMREGGGAVAVGGDGLVVDVVD
jgi:hypothetical protein